MSTPKFIKYLTEMSDRLIHVANKDDVMKADIKKLNALLPASVYLPFVSKSSRNYAVLHIVADEARIFVTKERAPMLICLEVYRPEEISI